MLMIRRSNLLRGGKKETISLLLSEFSKKEKQWETERKGEERRGGEGRGGEERRGRKEGEKV